MYDVIIVGGGPAGLTAALYAARKKLELAILTSDLGGQVMWTRDIENYMGYQFITGPELMQKFDEQIQGLIPDDAIRYETAIRLEQSTEGIIVQTRQGNVYETKSVIVATGKNPRRLEVPGEQEYRGRGVSYCATCDGPLFKNKIVAVIGGGNSALQSALELSKVAAKVYLVDRSGYRAEPIIVEKVEETEKIAKVHRHTVREILGGQTVERIVLCGDDKTLVLDVQGIFVEVGLEPNTDWLSDAIALNERREVIADCRCRTSLEGVFAAGDVTDSIDKQIIIAAGDGAKAAMAVGEYLLRK